MVHLRRKILSFGNLVNQLQNVRWSSSLKTKDRKSVQSQRSFKYADLSVCLAGPDQLNPKPDVKELSFGKYFTDHILKIHYYENMNGWQAPEIMPFGNITLHPAAKVLHYAIEMFEGMKAYRGVDGKIRLFRPELNMERMLHSTSRIGLPSFRSEELIKCICRLISIDQEWVPHSTTSSLYIRPTFIGVDPTLGVVASDSALLYVIMSPVGSYLKTAKQQGISLFADPKFTRAWPGGCGNSKFGSNYAPTIQAQQEACEKGLHQVLWLFGENHELTEMGTMNVFIVYINDNGERELLTPPLSGLILPGVVRNSLLSMAREWNQFRVSEKSITMKEIIQLLSENRLLEIFGAGTANVISPVSCIEFLGQLLHIPTMEQPEPIYHMLKKHLLDIQYGVIPEHSWSLIIE
ncbi:Branched-chain-amino-acid aminotransferase, cytosolic [Camponotus floridanus]|uniref:Branched-chain-amino-acid aminotransferase n=1 Tax=Camponotus floridanus TaxID=104421 RepID=E2A8V2_CAMFO|nr:branched-chain-amino-acid aminotransferase, cytosolic [Camponotus floridanus]EFN70181.1 Branched-chain-amino-acid aminotransferase, cytosolic [Camponotus floridanus]